MVEKPRRRIQKRQIVHEAEMTVMVRTIIRSLLPLILVFGIYIVTYGHLTPGGGFQGGMILVGAVMSFYLAYGYNIVRRFHEEDLDLAEHIGALGYVFIGLLGVFFGVSFLSNVLKGGAPGTLISGGIILILNFVVGFKVAAGTLLVVLILLESLQKGESKRRLLNRLDDQ
ncbi:MAG: cation:proton antiporter [Burkholderiales bacterium]|nr:cation:proton antiporter [Anaerolineae bacterium]